jgi:hypothetical protein
MSSLLGLGPECADGLMSDATIHGPEGLSCRLQFADDGAVAVRPEVLLPMVARDLAEAGMGRLLAMQAALTLELGWHLGVSPEGLLQLSPLAWIDSPLAAVTALDLGQAVGMQALHALFEDALDCEVVNDTAPAARVLQ